MGIGRRGFDFHLPTKTIALLQTTVFGFGGSFFGACSTPNKVGGSK
jgi:hypothetical protein